MRPSNPLRNVALFKNVESVAIAPQVHFERWGGDLSPQTRVHSDVLFY